MERLVVKNFLLLQDVDIEIKKYNFLLGPQASGKSVLAKLMYFIYQIPTYIKEGLINNSVSEEINDLIRDNFKSIFPEVYWGDNLFEISYFLDDLNIKLENKQNRLNSINISFNKPFDKVFKEIFDISRISKISYKSKSIDDLVEIKSRNDTVNLSFLEKILNKNKTINAFFDKSSSFFVPSSRCVYSILADKPATNSSTFSNDLLLNQFGRLYENLKDIYETILNDSKDYGVEFKKRSEKLLRGKYLYEKKQDYISVNNKKINIKYASSGQQEVLPLLVILGIFSTIYANVPTSERFYFIEEPEAHLFPEAQVEMMSLLSFVGYKGNSNFFITTHSPYLLSILNNFLYGTMLIDKGKIDENIFYQITQGACPIKTSDVNAFTLENGKSESLMDEDGVFVDSSVLDSASTFINDMYDKFIDYVVD